MIRVTFLGTAASRPTVGRNVSALAVQREGDLWLWDCGEGTQRQMMRYQTGFGVQGVFITHLHADHYLGVIGLLRTLALQAREEPLLLFGPPGSKDILHASAYLGVNRIAFPLEIQELEPGDRVARDEYDIQAIEVAHGTPAIGFALREHDRPGRFDVERARALGIPEGPLFGRLHRGEAVEVEGRWIGPDAVVGPPRPGRTLVYTGDTRPSEIVQREARGARLLIHDATFGEDEVDRARATFHSTARGAAQVARRAQVDRLLLTHISARYAADPRPLEEEARSVFPQTSVAYDGLAVEIGYEREEGDA
jgi:ribonuclease Z